MLPIREALEAALKACELMGLEAECTEIESGEPGLEETTSLSTEDPSDPLLPARGRRVTGEIVFDVAGTRVAGRTAAAFYIAVWTWLLKNRLVAADLPIGGVNGAGYVAAAEPVHPSGRPFLRAAEVEGTFLEMNLSRADIIRRAKKYLTLFDVKFEVITTSGGDDAPRA